MTKTARAGIMRRTARAGIISNRATPATEQHQPSSAKREEEERSGGVIGTSFVARHKRWRACGKRQEMACLW
jgi:hypothetical protein